MRESTVWSFYSVTTGEFSGVNVTGSIDVANNCPPDLRPVIGLWPPGSWVFDLTEQVIKPRVHTSEQLDPVGAAMDAMAAIRAVEARLQRSQREVILALLNGTPPPSGAVDALTQADFEIGQLRASLPLI